MHCKMPCSIAACLFIFLVPAAAIPPYIVTTCRIFARREGFEGSDHDLCAGQEAGLLSVASKAVMFLSVTERRENHFVEICSGTGGASHAVRIGGHTAEAFDRVYGEVAMDLCSLVGLVYAGVLVTRLIQRGVLWLSPQCSNWLWVARFTSGRMQFGNGVFGYDDRRDVLEANVTASAVHPAGANVVFICKGNEQANTQESKLKAN